MSGRFSLAALVAVLCASGARAQPLPPSCGGLCRPNRAGLFVARTDVQRSDGMDGDDLLAIVNRSPTGALPPEYAPGDLVDLETMRPARASQCTPPARQCLRSEAAAATQRLLTAMRAEGLSPFVASAFRSYRVQCATFLGWTERERGGFCEAATASALPGHSQHQLGTSLDLFTHDWAMGGDRFRAGFGCTPAGRWLEEHAHEHGFVLPYPLHPDYRSEGSTCSARERGGELRIDPRTGYRYEPWHLRYVGVEHARRFREAWRASGVGTLSEIAFEQWLRAARGLDEPIAPPVCDGCNCGACATLAGDERSPCAGRAMQLDAQGRAVAATELPALLSVAAAREGASVVLRVTINVPQGTWTQPPILNGASFRRGSREAILADRAPRPFAPLPGAWRLGIGPGESGWPWQAALVGARRRTEANGLNARLVAEPGTLTMQLTLEAVAPGTTLRVALVAEGEPARGEQRLVAP
ncbi:MAG: M15 family metallopeptidase [Sandaracinaceae bacterium]|nr:M15 family metallopeptidase [Sandaracinaceae bacterium]